MEYNIWDPNSNFNLFWDIFSLLNNHFLLYVWPKILWTTKQASSSNLEAKNVQIATKAIVEVPLFFFLLIAYPVLPPMHLKIFWPLPFFFSVPVKTMQNRYHTGTCNWSNVNLCHKQLLLFSSKVNSILILLGVRAVFYVNII